MAIQDKPFQPGEPNQWRIINEELDNRQKAEFMSGLAAPLSEQEQAIKKVSQVLFTAVAEEAVTEHALKEARRGRNTSEEIFEAAQKYREAEGKAKGAIEAFKETYVKNMSHPA